VNYRDIKRDTMAGQAGQFQNSDVPQAGQSSGYRYLIYPGCPVKHPTGTFCCG